MLTAFRLLIAIILLLFVGGWRWRRDVFLLPSTWIMLLAALLYVAPVLAFEADVEELSPYATTALLYCSVLICAGMLTNLFFTNRRDLAALLPDDPRPRAPETVGGEGEPPQRGATTALRRVLAVLALLMAWYLIRVPLTSTGLWGILFDPENSALIREEALKLLDSRGLQYAYTIGFSALCPLAFTLLLARAGDVQGSARWWLLLTVGPFLAFYLLLAGARVGLFNLALVGAIYAFLRNRLRLGWRLVVGSALLALVAPVALSILRERGSDTDPLAVIEGLGERIFLIPLLIGGWYVEFASTYGHAGLSAALGLGDQVNWSNVIALEYFGRKQTILIESVTTPAAYFFYLFLYFGWLGLIPSWLALRVIDAPVGWALRARPELRAPLVATLLYFAVVFVQAGFGTVLLTHGFLFVALVAFFAARGWAETSPPEDGLVHSTEPCTSSSPGTATS